MVINTNSSLVDKEYAFMLVIGGEKTVTNEDVGDVAENQVDWIEVSNEEGIIVWKRPYAKVKNW